MIVEGDTSELSKVEFEVSRMLRQMKTFSKIIPLCFAEGLDVISDHHKRSTDLVRRPFRAPPNTKI